MTINLHSKPLVSKVEGISLLILLLLGLLSLETAGRHCMSAVLLLRSIKGFEGVHSSEGRLVGVHTHVLLHAAHHWLEATHLMLLAHLLLLAHHWLEARSWLSTVEGIAVILRASCTHHHAEGVYARQILCLVLLCWLLLGFLACGGALAALIKAIEEGHFVVRWDLVCFRS